jgi:hypothetical protein
MLPNKAEANPSVALNFDLPMLPNEKILVQPEKGAKDKHPILFCSNIIDEKKSFSVFKDTKLFLHQ